MRTARRVGLHRGGFSTREDGRGRHQKADVIRVSDVGLVHDRTRLHGQPTAYLRILMAKRGNQGRQLKLKSGREDR